MTSYREQLKFFFDKLNLAKVKWDIVADDGTIHPFTNHDVIDTFNVCPEKSLQGAYNNLKQIQGDTNNINNYLKEIATYYTNNRFTLIKALKEDYEKQTTNEGKQFFYDILKNFTENDLEKAGVLGFWKRINSQ